MPVLVGVASAPPPFTVEQSLAAMYAREAFAAAQGRIDHLMPVFTNVGVERRQVCRPPEWYRAPHALAESSRIYIESATDLCVEAARRVLARCGREAGDIDRVIYVNTTGLATPSIDARLANVLGFRRNIRRTPVWGLGCAGGVAGLAHAFSHLEGHPRERVLVFAAEMCSLTLLHHDASAANVIATALFGDGAAAALVSGDETGDLGYPLVDARSTLYPDSLDVMGWNVVNEGLQVIFDRRIPAIAASHAGPELDAFLGEHGLTRADIVEFLYHPGGPRVLEAYAQAYGRSVDDFAWSRTVLREHGNMSSATVLYVLERYAAAHQPGRGGHAVISALGPGFSSESILMQL